VITLRADIVGIVSVHTPLAHQIGNIASSSGYCSGFINIEAKFLCPVMARLLLHTSSLVAEVTFAEKWFITLS